MRLPRCSVVVLSWCERSSQIGFTRAQAASHAKIWDFEKTQERNDGALSGWQPVESLAGLRPVEPAVRFSFSIFSMPPTVQLALGEYIILIFFSNDGKLYIVRRWGSLEMKHSIHETHLHSDVLRSKSMNSFS